MKRVLTAMFACALALANDALAYLAPAEAVQRAGFEQRLGASIPAALAFRDEQGDDVELGHYFGSTPIVLVFAWYGCTTLCPTVVGKLAHVLARSGLDASRYRVLVASIDPRDAPADAMRIKERYVVGKGGDASAWHLLTGSESSIGALASAVGFRYAYDDESHQYAHPAGFVLLTPQGDIARYVLGFDYTPATVRDGIKAAAAREIASPVDRLLLVCFHFAPSGRHSAVVLQLLQIASIGMLGTVLALFIANRRRGAR